MSDLRALRDGRVSNEGTAPKLPVQLPADPTTKKGKDQDRKAVQKLITWVESEEAKEEEEGGEGGGSWTKGSHPSQRPRLKAALLRAAARIAEEGSIASDNGSSHGGSVASSRPGSRASGRAAEMFSA